MKRDLKRVISLFVCATLLFSVGCGGGDSGNGHTHVFDQQVVESQYKKSDATCTEAAQYYYSCVCGEKGSEPFSMGIKAFHSYTAEKAEAQYLKDGANCQSPAVYYKSCVYCGKNSGSDLLTFTAGEVGTHAYTEEKATAEYLKYEATFDSAAVYYKSCACGLKGGEDATFSYGAPLRELTDEEKIAYQPISLTMTLYDVENSVYGFTWNTQNNPLRAVIQYEKGETLTENAQEVGVDTTKESYYNDTDTDKIYYYVSKAELKLEPNTTYTYRVYDKYAQIGTEAVTFQTKDTKSTSFSFAHVSDTQSVPSSGANFATVLKRIVGENDFVLHTGDIVEYSKYESEWTDMLHTNFAYLSKVPLMAVSGNHDTTYKSGYNELWKHFNNNIPEQTSTGNGYYYSFTYGNAKFIMLNTNNNGSSRLEEAQYKWVENELKNNTCDWTFVAMHAPLYSIGQWGADSNKNYQSLALRAQLQGLFAEYGVDIVFQGHDHLLSRTKPIDMDGNPTVETWQTEDGVEYSVDPNGVLYVMDGMVGTNSKSVIATEEELEKYYRNAQSSAQCTWAEITINGNELIFEVKYTSGSTDYPYYTWGIKKTA
ncbi:MAG: metallophosphoesterase family protein [Clostridia bacterium]|nr:metallophosphoesterase family protein [Clostridia bacterium]